MIGEALFGAIFIEDEINAVCSRNESVYSTRIGENIDKVIVVFGGECVKQGIDDGPGGDDDVGFLGL